MSVLTLKSPLLLRLVSGAFPRSFRIGLEARGRADGAGSTAPWRATLAGAIGELENLNRVTERDFLAVGGKLRDLLAAARRISSAMSALTEMISGPQGGNASRELTRMMEHALRLESRMESNRQALGAVREPTRAIQFAFLRLQETVAVIRALCTLTRIETSRLGADGSDFGHLADEVNPLSAKIHASGQGVLNASGLLDRGVQAALKKGADLSATQLKELHLLMAAVMESLRSFEERQAQAREASLRGGAQHAAVLTAIEDLVRSVQFHDITRQQIEHACEALGEIRSQATREGRLAPPEVRTGLALQASHLASAADSFAESMASMRRDLESIAARAADMAESSKSLLGPSGDQQNAFFTRMEESFSAILKALEACAAAESELSGTVSELEGILTGMRASIEEIRGVEIHIQRIAINATIRSAHIGEAGNGLNVIADAMHRVATDSSQNTEEVAGSLDSMGAAVLRVGGPVGAAPSSQDPAGGAADQMRGAIRELHASSEESHRRVGEIGALSLGLSGEIRALLGGLSSGPLFEQVVARARQQIERVAGLTVGGSAGNGAHHSTAELEKLRERYTMQTEHDVHAALFAGAAIPRAEPPAEAAARPGGDDLGGNVELF